MNVVDNQGRSALHLAVEKGNVAMVTALISQGADVEAFTTDGYRFVTRLRIAQLKECMYDIYHELVLVPVGEKLWFQRVLYLSCPVVDCVIGISLSKPSC